MKVALLIGHNPKDKGAYSNVLGQYEYEYYRDVCSIINEIDDSIDIYTREPIVGYVAQMVPVIEEMNKHNYDFILELHFNAVKDTNVRGCETLVYKDSKKGHELALNFLKKVHETFDIPYRGGKLIEIKYQHERGGYGICNTKSPYILVEPFFGTNDIDSSKFKNRQDIAEFIVDFIRGQS
ncbi:hypothetical protein IX317_000356 [Fusobacterium sp. DD29]|uniref:N-acetylmuramoyl-L-alanine amidase n=1 Tax=unclassified Fusobacterium TaxID=2648384 RepID=UPI001B8D80AB|nr:MULTISPECIES: N-acetylmuramoyl-L-alanine amidase [unclassified Fusobacterium]MBR8748697.1 hypothetical protein [Fusobacterium sp. DD29]MBR8760951.1 hypothetical protein [Fusobacterium sp. DD25]MBR8766976.1 hypothetical protein [Fusobacterium sp. DD43]MBR8770977.1 hypothetical protein [Fusobacterium sp. DD40]MBR8775252.1 hypothetical protein [Fusobacterium sp. DD17]